MLTLPVNYHIYPHSIPSPQHMPGLGKAKWRNSYLSCSALLFMPLIIDSYFFLRGGGRGEDRCSTWVNKWCLTGEVERTEEQAGIQEVFGCVTASVCPPLEQSHWATCFIPRGEPLDLMHIPNAIQGNQVTQLRAEGRKKKSWIPDSFPTPTQESSLLTAPTPNPPCWKENQESWQLAPSLQPLPPPFWAQKRPFVWSLCAWQLPVFSVLSPRGFLCRQLPHLTSMEQRGKFQSVVDVERT